jgi:hypothetical protein
MATAIAPDQQQQGPVMPPGMVETVTPSSQPGPYAVAQVNLEYPERFNRIAESMSAAAQDPKARLQLAQDISSHDVESRDLNMNQQPQWGKVIANLLSRNYNEALKWYNGGGEVDEEARDMNNNVYYKQKNERGVTGKVFDASGKLLTAPQLKELESRGGVFTLTDDKSLKTLPWVNGKYNAELANKGLTTALQLATNDAYNAARTAGGANQNIDEQLKLAGSMKGVLNHIGTLPADRRQKLFGYISRLNQIANSSGSSSEGRVNVNAGGSQTAGNTAGVSAGGAAGPDGTPMTSGKVGGALGASGSATNQQGVSGGLSGAQTNSANAMLQEQQNLQTAIMQELQGVIKPEQFSGFMRLQALNSANEDSYKNIPAHAKPPTWKDVATTDPFAGGAESMVANRVDQQRNNALMAAWSKELYKSQREMAKSGKAFDKEKLAEEFQKSQIFEAINNTYKYKLQSNLEGRQVMPPKGMLMVNNRNEIGRSPGE